MVGKKSSEKRAEIFILFLQFLCTFFCMSYRTFWFGLWNGSLSLSSTLQSQSQLQLHWLPCPNAIKMSAMQKRGLPGGGKNGWLTCEGKWLGMECDILVRPRDTDQTRICHAKGTGQDTRLATFFSNWSRVGAPGSGLDSGIPKGRERVDQRPRPYTPLSALVMYVN